MYNLQYFLSLLGDQHEPASAKKTFERAKISTTSPWGAAKIVVPSRRNQVDNS